MQPQIFHIFRNTPLGRETFLQTLHFCRKTGCSPVIYIPRSVRFLLYFENDVVQVDLDTSYLTDPDTAIPHAEHLLAEAGMEGVFFDPRQFTAATLPDIPTHFDFMCCPRTISDLSSKIGLGYIGPKVRRIVNSARFPVLITGSMFKPWESVTVMFGGSANAVNALRLGLRIARMSGLPLDLFTLVERPEEEYRRSLEAGGLAPEVEEYLRRWLFLDNPRMECSLYDVPHDSLVVMGAYGHGLFKDFVFGSHLERVQSTICNPLLIVGPKYTAGVF